MAVSKHRVHPNMNLQDDRTIVNFLIHWSGYPLILQCEDQKIICGWHSVWFFMCTLFFDSPTASQGVPRSHAAHVLFPKVTGFSPVRAKKSLELAGNCGVWLPSGVDFIWPVSKTYWEFEWLARMARPTLAHVKNTAHLKAGRSVTVSPLWTLSLHGVWPKYQWW